MAGERDQTPPVAPVIPVELEAHGHIRVDPYYWLREREDPEVISYLEAENAYTEAMMAHTAGLQDALYEEIRNRIKQTDETVPYRQDEYFYYTRYEDGREYPIHCRKRGTLDAPEEIMLDVNAMAQGHGFFSVGQFAVSAGQDLLAYPVDTIGRCVYALHIKDLSSGEMRDDVIPDTTDNVVWAEDNQTLFYTKQDPITLRWYRIYRHVMGTDPAHDELVYEEKDDTFNCFVFKTRSRRYVVIGSHQTLSTEYHVLSTDEPDGAFALFEPRKPKHEYSIDHHGDYFYIRTNDGARNFRLMRTRLTETGRDHWEEVIPHRKDVLLEGVELFAHHMVIVERAKGLIRMRIRPWSGEAEHELDFGEPAYLAYASDNHTFDTPVLRYTYTSLTTPKSVFDYHMDTRDKTLLKQDEVLGGFDAANYVTERLWATAADGTAVPISVVYRQDTPRDGSSPLLLYGYGSYGYSTDATFSAERVSLLDRGFVFAIAHVRGGEEMGRQWYETGRLLYKKNSFTDFIACAEHLIALGYTTPQRLFAMGGSAGGLLVGAVSNMRPDLFAGIVASVPFVDVITTMLDETIPLTTSEYDEWGNPNDKTYYDYMLSYSPYDNVAPQAYPHMLILTSLPDSQVQYWEPAKWVARLRALKTDSNRLLLRTKMEAGHGGVSGRYKRYRETAFIYAFLLDTAQARSDLLTV